MKKEFSSKSDVWSFGVTCLEILTRQRPYPHLSIAEFSANALEEITKIASYIPNNTPELLVDCFQWDANNRPSFNEIVERLEELSLFCSFSSSFPSSSSLAKEPKIN
jgi:serine/threonine protein kinase